MKFHKSTENKLLLLNYKFYLSIFLLLLFMLSFHPTSVYSQSGGGMCPSNKTIYMSEEPFNAQVPVMDNATGLQSYSLLRNGTTVNHEVFKNGSYFVVLNISVNHLDVGFYNYTIILTSNSGITNHCSFGVTILQSTTTFSSTSIVTTPKSNNNNNNNIFNILVFGTIVVLIISGSLGFLKYRYSKEKSIDDEIRKKSNKSDSAVKDLLELTEAKIREKKNK